MEINKEFRSVSKYGSCFICVFPKEEKFNISLTDAFDKVIKETDGPDGDLETILRVLLLIKRVGNERTDALRYDHQGHIDFANHIINAAKILTTKINEQRIIDDLTKQLGSLSIDSEHVTEVDSDIYDLLSQIANIQLSKLAEETAKESLELTQTSYANGAVNIVQLLDAQINYLESQLSSSTANYNYLLRTMQLERYIGFFFLLETQEEQQEFVNRFLEYSSNN